MMASDTRSQSPRRSAQAWRALLDEQDRRGRSIFSGFGLS